MGIDFTIAFKTLRKELDSRSRRRREGTYAGCTEGKHYRMGYLGSINHPCRDALLTVIWSRADRPEPDHEEE